MNRLTSPVGKITPPVAATATKPAPSVPVLAADVLETLIRQLQAETAVEPSARPLSPPRSRQVQFGMD